MERCLKVVAYLFCFKDAREREREREREKSNLHFLRLIDDSGSTCSSGLVSARTWWPCSQGPVTLASSEGEDEEDKSLVILTISTPLFVSNRISGFAAFVADCCGLPRDLGSLSHCGHTHARTHARTHTRARACSPAPVSMQNAGKGRKEALPQLLTALCCLQWPTFGMLSRVRKWREEER